jgi:hypothetical protein
MTTIMIIADDGKTAECPRCGQLVRCHDPNARITCHCDDADKHEQLQLPGM